MPIINILSPHLADLIAAGEVVERPASVIKELMENAVDAGAKNLIVEYKNGGLTYIRCTDDGSGMSAEDAGICFLRHATSKLHSASGLEAIGTMGFRGEALAAIASVSKIELLTRERGAETGTRLLIEAGEIADMREAGCPEGTTVIVRDLFYNTPARLKFMKSDRAESSACREAALRCALGQPHVSVRLVVDGREEFRTGGDGELASAVYSLLGREVYAELIPCLTEEENVRIEGLISRPSACRGNRGGQYFYCNGRAIKSQSLQSALERAYRGRIQSGRFPRCVLNISVRPSAVDVNVHPAKTEVRFVNERQVWESVYNAALSALERDEGIVRTYSPPAVEISGESAPEQTVMPEQKIIIMEDSTEEQRASLRSPNQSYGYSHPVTTGDFDRPSLRYEDIAPLFVPIELPVAGDENAEAEFIDIQPRQQPDAETAQAVPVFRVLGELLDTYILAEHSNALVFIDKHAAHERIIYDRLLRDDLGVMSQALLSPLPFSPGGEGTELLLESEPLLNRLGFEIEPFGDMSVIIRAVPADVDLGEVPPLMEEITVKLSAGTGGAAEREVLYSVACKAAIKAGRSSEPEELRALTERVLSGEVSYCPHGRPVSFRLSREELDKRMGR